MFASTYESAVKYLTLEQMGELFVKLGKIAFNGENAGSDNPVLDVLLRDAKPVMNSALDRHMQAIENGYKGKEYGIMGGRPRKGENRDEYDARRLERARSISEGGGNPQKPLDIDKDNDIDIEKDIKKETDINKNTNIEIITNSISANNHISSNLKPSLDKTRTGEEPGAGTRPQPKNLSDSSNLEEETKHGEEPRKDERARQAGNNLSNVVIPSVPPDEQFSNCIGDLQDLIQHAAGPDYGSMSRNELGEFFTRNLEAAIDYEGKEGRSKRFEDAINSAKMAYMRLHGCDDEQAKKGVNWLYKQRRSSRGGVVKSTDDGSDMKLALEQTISREIQTLQDCDAGKKPKTFYAPAFERATKAAMKYYSSGEESAKNIVRRLKAEL